MDLDWQLLTSLLHDNNLSALDHAFREPQLLSCNKIQCMYACKQLPGNQSFDIGKYLPKRSVVVSGGWGNGSRLTNAYEFAT